MLELQIIHVYSLLGIGTIINQCEDSVILFVKHEVHFSFTLWDITLQSIPRQRSSDSNETVIGSLRNYFKITWIWRTIWNVFFVGSEILIYWDVNSCSSSLSRSCCIMVIENRCRKLKYEIGRLMFRHPL